MYDAEIDEKFPILATPVISLAQEDQLLQRL